MNVALQVLKKLKLQKFAKATAAKVGVDIEYRNARFNTWLRLNHFIKLQRIDTVLDIGANAGQFATDLLKGGFKGRVISFEALPEAHAEMLQRAKSYSANWIVHEQSAVSDKKGATTFHVTKANTSSSLMKPNETFNANFVGAEVTREIIVATFPLDDVISRYKLDQSRFLLKIDVQGAEQLVLDGAKKALGLAQGIQMEVGIVTSYEGQSGMQKHVSQLAERGLKLWDILPGYRDGKTLRLNECDILCFRD
jgi:FkbM family methyltransferase